VLAKVSIQQVETKFDGHLQARSASAHLLFAEPTWHTEVPTIAK